MFSASTGHSCSAVDRFREFVLRACPPGEQKHSQLYGSQTVCVLGQVVICVHSSLAQSKNEFPDCRLRKLQQQTQPVGVSLVVQRQSFQRSSCGRLLSITQRARLTSRYVCQTIYHRSTRGQDSFGYGLPFILSCVRS